jgi:hypothetical protein
MTAMLTIPNFAEFRQNADLYLKTDNLNDARLKGDQSSKGTTFGSIEVVGGRKCGLRKHWRLVVPPYSKMPGRFGMLLEPMSASLRAWQAPTFFL